MTNHTDPLMNAVANLIKVKGRYHTEQAYKQLVEAYDAAIKQNEELHKLVLEFDTWLNAPPSREVPEPEEARLYRFDAYKQWEKVAVAALKIAKEPTK